MADGLSMADGGGAVGVRFDCSRLLRKELFAGDRTQRPEYPFIANAAIDELLPDHPLQRRLVRVTSFIAVYCTSDHSLYASC